MFCTKTLFFVGFLLSPTMMVAQNDPQLPKLSSHHIVQDFVIEPPSSELKCAGLCRKTSPQPQNGFELI
jgi:hypothetical protein